MSRISKVTAIIVLLSLSLLSLAFSADETITITTYYPSPTGSYKDLEVQRLAVAYAAGSPNYWDNMVTIRTLYGDTLGIGGDGSGNDAEIRLEAPVARQKLKIWGGTGGIGSLTPMWVEAANIPSCVKKSYTATSGNCSCGDWNCDNDYNDSFLATDGTTVIRESSDYYLAFKLATGATYASSGWYLCCQAKEYS